MVNQVGDCAVRRLLIAHWLAAGISGPGRLGGARRAGHPRGRCSDRAVGREIETIGGLERVGGVLVGTGPTTGLVVSDDGYIISSAFNFIQQPTSILVTLPGGQRAAAKIVARDHSRMLVLLKVKTEPSCPCRSLCRAAK